MDSSVAVRTPAKINLTLDIVGKRSDGYHFMKTVMQSVSICDTVSVELTDKDGIEISCDDENVPRNEKNIVHKAAAAFFEYTKLKPCGLDISIEKNIPMQAGLAGGSANAAGVIVALDELFETELSTHQLCEIGVKVGADVPFCIAGGTALAEGIGEILTPLPAMPECSIVVAKGKEGISTAEAFKKYDGLIIEKHPDNDEMVVALAVGNIEKIGELCMNVLEEAADIPEIQMIKKTMLDCGALCAVMTGSGSAVYGIFPKKKHALACLDELDGLADFAKLCTPIDSGAQIIK